MFGQGTAELPSCQMRLLARLVTQASHQSTAGDDPADYLLFWNFLIKHALQV